jgi:hypothetical protein
LRHVVAIVAAFSELKRRGTKADKDGNTDHQEDIMGDFILIGIHVVSVTAIYISAYRAGFKVCRDESQRRAETYTAPLAEILERLNMDIETLLDDEKDRGGPRPNQKRPATEAGRCVWGWRREWDSNPWWSVTPTLA